jgi:hypothetical protein
MAQLIGRVHAHATDHLVAILGDASDWYRSLFFSFQSAVQTGRTQALSTPCEFVSTLGWEGRRFSGQVWHISNGNLHHPNRGEIMALLGVAFDP